MPSASEYISLLKDDFNDRDIEVPLQAAKRVGLVAKAIGPDATRSRLLPFLLDVCEMDNDEANAHLAKSLSSFVPLVGGSQHTKALLPVLERLFGIVEVVVRKHTAESFETLVQSFPKSEVLTVLLPFLKRLVSGDDWPLRASAAAILPSVYKCVPEADSKARFETVEMFSQLCNDSVPLVRIEASDRFGSLSSHMDANTFSSDILPLLKSLSEDISEPVRKTMVNACAKLAVSLPVKGFQQTVLPVLKGLQDDVSWRIRAQVATVLPSLFLALPDDVNNSTLVPIFTVLATDSEAEVRVKAAQVLAKLPAEIKETSKLLHQIQPAITALSADPIQTVREGLAKALLPLLLNTPPKQSQLLLGITQQLARDELHGVRRSVVALLSALLQGEAVDSPERERFIQRLLPAMYALSKDPNWRVRRSVVNECAPIGTKLGKKAFEKYMRPALIAALLDHVHAIRDAACLQVGLLVGIFGGEWAEQELLGPCLAQYDTASNYTHRSTCLRFIQHIAEQKCLAKGELIFTKSLLPIAQQGARDVVANVRVAAAGALGVLYPKLGSPNLLASTVEILTRLQEDTDDDVMHTAQTYLSKIHMHF